MAKNYILALFLFLGFCVQSQELAQGPPPPTGCNPYGVIDTDNDGYASFNVDWITGVYFPGRAMYYFGYDVSGYLIQLFPSENDLDPITTSTYTNILTPEQYTYARFTYIGPGPQYDEMFLNAYVGGCLILTPLAADGDYDNDGISNIDEDANGNGDLNDDDADGDWFGDYLEPNALGNEGFALRNSYIAPNPASGIINIGIANDQKYDLAIYDLTGKQVLEITNTSQKTIDISSLNAGIYLVKLNQESEQFHQKLVVQ